MLRSFTSILVFIIIAGCKQEDIKKDDSCSNTEISVRKTFQMGFSSWSYGPDRSQSDATYEFISEHADIYSEQVDESIPWNSWLTDVAIPDNFSNNISYRLDQRLGHELLLSVSLFNTDRTELLADHEGSIPEYDQLDDPNIVEAYTKHVSYLIEQFEPNYLVIAMEVNDFRLKNPEKWEAYKSMISSVKETIKTNHPKLPISESVTLHNWLTPDTENPNAYITEITDYVNQMDFAAISFYPFFEGFSSQEQFQTAFDFLHERVHVPIAFVETTHLAENLSIDAYDLFIPSDPCQQNEYLKTLLTNADQENYSFLIWWAHRDFDLLWETFPSEVKDLGKLWRDTGLLDEDGNPRPAFSTWDEIFNN